jgi:hypothetical protein
MIAKGELDSADYYFDNSYRNGHSFTRYLHEAMDDYDSARKYSIVNQLMEAKINFDDAI